MRVFKERKNILGIIGGMGPSASNLFCDMIVENNKVRMDQDHIDFVLLNHASMPDRTTCIKEGRTDDLLDYFSQDIVFLEDAGVCAIAIPCNTSHAVYDRISAMTDLEVLNMLEETVSWVVKKDLARPGDNIGLLATDGTVEMGLYQKAFDKVGIDLVLPEPAIQKQVMSLIYDGVKAGRRVDAKELEDIEKHMRDAGCVRIVLGCTELSVIRRDNGGLTDYYLDAMECLARAAIDRCGGKNE